MESADERDGWYFAAVGESGDGDKEMMNYRD